MKKTTSDNSAEYLENASGTNPIIGGIIVLGYAPGILGGVAKSTQRLLSVLPDVELHPILFTYGSRFRSIALTTGAWFRYARTLIKRKPRLTVITVASRGDVIRTVPFILTCLIAGHPHVLLFRTSVRAMLNGPESHLIRGFVRRLWAKSNAQVFLSGRLQSEYASEFGVDPVRAFVIPNVLDDDWLGLELKPLEKRSSDVVYVGRWSHEKGASTISSAFHLSRLGGRWSCDVYGESAISQSDCSLKPHGWVSHGDLKNVVASAKLLVLPSHAEAYPNVLVEALACGTPIVCSDVGGSPDIAEASQGGLVFKAGDLESFCLCVASILNDEDLWRKMSWSGYNFAQELTMHHLKKRWLQVLAAI
jgi:glycosyltransferase involved in cell wall biosynthesis